MSRRTTTGATTGGGPEPPRQHATVERDLARALGRRCRGRTLVLGRAFPALLERLARRGVEADVRACAAAPEARRRGEFFDTVLLVDALDLEPESSLELVRESFALLAPRGLLLVCVPRGDLVTGTRPRRISTPSGLKRLLKLIDHPKLFTDQPFQWLSMGLERDLALDHTVRRRCSVIAELCRGRVLELGCGPGHLCEEISRRGLTVVGVDLNAAKIEKARARYEGIDFHQADILELPLDTMHDTVVLAEVLEHVPARTGDRMLERAWSFVAPGGRLVVSVPNEHCVPHKNHVREFTLEDLRDLLSRLGEPRIVTTQPFKWLLMHVDRPKEAPRWRDSSARSRD